MNLVTILWVLLTLLMVLLALWLPNLKRGMTNVSYTSEIQLSEPHTVSFVSAWSWFRDRLQVQVDGATIMTTHVSAISQIGMILSGPGSHPFNIDGRQAFLRWRWSAWGDPLYIVLESEGRIMAQYGNEKAIQKLKVAKDGQASAMVETRLSTEKCDSEQVISLSVEEYPLDNRFGSDAITIEQELSKTVTNTLTIEETDALSRGVSAGVSVAIKGQIATDLAHRHNIAVGQAITRRDTFRFSVRAGKCVTYVVNWKQRVRNGRYSVAVDGAEFPVSYRAAFDLLYEITSKPTAGSTQAGEG